MSFYSIVKMVYEDDKNLFHYLPCEAALGFEDLVPKNKSDCLKSRIKQSIPFSKME